MIRAIFAALLVTGLAIAAPSAAREPNRQPPPVARSVSRPPPYSDPALARAQFARHCGANTVSEGVVNLPAGTRLGFAADPGEPARLVLCIDQAKVALAFPVASIEEALVFMAYKPFAPFWPAAEARWGNDMAILREEVRRKPIEQALADYAYAAMIPPETAAVIAASRTAGAAGDHAKALALVEDEVVRLAAANRAAQNGRGGAREGSAPQFGFDMSLLILRIGNLVANAEGPSAGADRIAALLAQYRLDPDYRVNPEINRAALLAEAGRSDEALAAISPLLEDFDPSFPKAIAGSEREYSWIMACALNGAKGAEAAAPFVELINAIRTQPVDPNLAWIRSNASIKLRMFKCLGDADGYAAAFRAERPAVLSPLWLEFQPEGRSQAGQLRLAPEARARLASELAGDYRELPDTYRAALQAWWPQRKAQTQ